MAVIAFHILGSELTCYCCLLKLFNPRVHKYVFIYLRLNAQSIINEHNRDKFDSSNIKVLHV